MDKPKDFSEDAMARWLTFAAGAAQDQFSSIGGLRMARAVRTLLREKVREAVRETIRVLDEIDLCDEDERTIVARVLGEAPRG